MLPSDSESDKNSLLGAPRLMRQELRVERKIPLKSAPVAVKQNRPPGRASPERAPGSVLRSRLCLPVGRGIAMVTPVSTYYYLGELFALPRDNSRVAPRCDLSTL